MSVFVLMSYKQNKQAGIPETTDYHDSINMIIIWDQNSIELYWHDE